VEGTFWTEIGDVDSILLGWRRTPGGDGEVDGELTWDWMLGMERCGVGA